METSLILGFSGFFISIFAVLFGGSMFFSVPVFQLLFPGATIGAIVGSIKAGSFARGLITTLKTAPHIRFESLPLYSFLLIWGVFGAFSIAELSQDYLLPVVIVGILVTVFSNKLEALISRSANASGAKHILAFTVGVYGGFFGAGVALLVFALIRIFEPERYGSDDHIIEAKIQARFLEFILVIVALTGHLISGTITTANSEMWLPWTIGAGFGGLVGAMGLIHLKKAPTKVQQAILYGSFAVALLTAIIVHFDLIDDITRLFGGYGTAN